MNKQRLDELDENVKRLLDSWTKNKGIIGQPVVSKHQPKKQAFKFFKLFIKPE